jgi:hypothetical protein
VETLTQHERTKRLRAIVSWASTFSEAVQRVMRVENVSQGEATLLVAKQSGPRGARLYNEFCRAGRP